MMVIDRTQCMLSEGTRLTASTLLQVLRQAADQYAERDFLLGPEQPSLSFAALGEQTERTRADLRASGLLGSRIGLLLPGGVVAAAATLALAASATCVPLNPALREAEFDRLLSELRLDAVIVPAGFESSIAILARQRGTTVLSLCPHSENSTEPFELRRQGAHTGSYAGTADKPAEPGANHTALLLYTSGTASRPKVVPLTHDNLLFAAERIGEALRLEPSDRSLLVMPLFHIHGLSVVLSSLLAGAVVVAPEQFQAPLFFPWLEEFRPTWYTAAPAIHRSILDRAPAHPESVAGHSLRFIRTASSAMPVPLLEELEALFHVPLIQAYGMTEAAPQIASNPLPPGRRKVGSVGLPAGPEVAILDPVGQPVSAGISGEVAVRGRNVMAGYEGDPEGNERAFAAGWLRTGDEGYLDQDGYLFVTGRIKEVINRGGEKISPAEVDQILVRHPAVSQAVAFGVPDERLGETVAAAVTLRLGQTVTETELRDYAAAHLSDFKVPRLIYILDALPAAEGGKIARSAVAAFLAESRGLASETVSTGAAGEISRTPTEEILTGIWEEVLGLEHIGIHDHFADLGGDSILAALISTRIQRALGVTPSVLAFLDRPTVAEMAETLDRMRQGTRGVTAQAIERRPASEPPCLSFAQQGLWFVDQLAPKNGAYNVFRAARLLGPLNSVVLERCLDELVARHEALRTTFPSHQGVPQVRIASGGRFPLEHVDLSNRPGCELEDGVYQLCVERAGQPFNLAEGPLWKGSLIRTGQDEHTLLLVTHHIVGERWALGILFRELASLYEAFIAGKPSPLPPPLVQYSDFSRWQRQWLGGDELARLEQYWKERLAGAPPVLELSADHPRPAVPSGRGARLPVSISLGAVEPLRALARREQATLYMTLLAAFKCLLYGASGQSDLVVGSPVAGRNRVELEGAVGWFSNTLALRTDLAGHPTFREVIARVRHTCLGAYDHQALSLDQVVNVVQPARNLSWTPLFQVNFRLQNAPTPEFRLPGLTLTPLDLDIRVAKFDLAVELWEAEQGINGFCEYNADLFEPATVRSLLDAFEQLIGTLVAQPDTPIDDLEPLAKLLQGVASRSSFRSSSGVRPRRKAVTLSNTLA